MRIDALLLGRSVHLYNTISAAVQTPTTNMLMRAKEINFSKTQLHVTKATSIAQGSPCGQRRTSCPHPCDPRAQMWGFVCWALGLRTRACGALRAISEIQIPKLKKKKEKQNTIQFLEWICRLSFTKINPASGQAGGFPTPTTKLIPTDPTAVSLPGFWSPQNTSLQTSGLEAASHLVEPAALRPFPKSCLMQRCRGRGVGAGV